MWVDSDALCVLMRCAAPAAGRLGFWRPVVKSTVGVSCVCVVCGVLAQGQVYALAFANNTLFTAGQDTSIRVWNLNEQAGIFVSQVGVCGCPVSHSAQLGHSPVSHSAQWDCLQRRQGAGRAGACGYPCWAQHTSGDAPAESEYSSTVM